MTTIACNFIALNGLSVATKEGGGEERIPFFFFLFLFFLFLFFPFFWGKSTHMRGSPVKRRIYNVKFTITLLKRASCIELRNHIKLKEIKTKKPVATLQSSLLCLPAFD